MAFGHHGKRIDVVSLCLHGLLVHLEKSIGKRLVLVQTRDHRQRLYEHSHDGVHTGIVAPVVDGGDGYALLTCQAV